MKYTSEITIGLPRERVIELFDDPDNLLRWQPGLQSFEPISGEPGQPGAKSRLIYDQGGRRIEMIETITARDLPDEFAGTYEMDGVWNRIANRFVQDGPERTRWVAETEFRFTGLMRLAVPFLRGTFARQSEDMMQRFKQFAEGQGA